jgi:hypothetical protein
MIDSITGSIASIVGRYWRARNVNSFARNVDSIILAANHSHFALPAFRFKLSR